MNMHQVYTDIWYRGYTLHSLVHSVSQRDKREVFDCLALPCSLFLSHNGRRGRQVSVCVRVYVFCKHIAPTCSLSLSQRESSELSDGCVNCCIFLFTLSLSQRERSEINMFVSRFMYFVNTLHPLAHSLSQ